MPQTYLWVIFHGGKTAFVIKLHEFTYSSISSAGFDFFFFKLTLNADIEMLILNPNANGNKLNPCT